MKKILAIAVSLVMVFAVAASAFALFGFKPSTTPVRVDGFKVEVDLYDRGTTGAGNSLVTGTYPVHAPTSGVRAGETYAFAVYLLMPAYNGLTATGQTLVTSPLTTLRVTTSNLTGFAATTARSSTAALVVPTYGAGMSNSTWGALPVNGTLTMDLADINALEDGAGNADNVPDAADEALCEFLFTAECTIRTLADASVTAVFGAPDPAVTTSDADELCMIGNFNVTSNAAYPATTQYVMTERDASGAATAQTVSFTVSGPDTAGNFTILDTFVTDGTLPAHRVAQDPSTGSIIYIDSSSGARNVNAVQVSVLNGILTRAMTSMGFTWTPGGVLYDQGFEALAARGLQFSDSATFYAYTASLVVPGGAAAVPDTGDSFIAGYVLIAVAVLTVAAVIAVRRLRA